jgi:hypothetical protein
VVRSRFAARDDWTLMEQTFVSGTGYVVIAPDWCSLNTIHDSTSHRFSRLSPRKRYRICSVRSLARVSRLASGGMPFSLAEHANPFTDADGLDAMFDASYIRYAMQSYRGEVFFSAPLHLGYQPFLRDSDAIEFASVNIGHLGDDLL